MLSVCKNRPTGLLELPRRLYATKSLASSDIFGGHHPQTFAACVGQPSDIPDFHRVPEIIVTGRANTGKSTLLAHVLGRPWTALVKTSKKPGKTRTLNFYRVGNPPGHLILVDSPGYGARGRQEWGDLFHYYIESRATLRRVYVLLNGKHGLNDDDEAMLEHLGEMSQNPNNVSRWTLQAIITKGDLLQKLQDPASQLRQMQQDIFEAAPTCLPGILTATTKNVTFGVDDVRRNMMEACGINVVKSTIVKGSK